MHRLGFLLIALAFLIEFAIPLKVLSLEGYSLAGIPAELFGIFASLVVQVIGVLIVYFTWYRHYATSMDQ